MRKYLALILIAILCVTLLMGCDEAEKNDTGETTDAVTTEAKPSLIDALNADNFINVTMELKMTVKEDDVAEPVALTNICKFNADSVELLSEGGRHYATDDPEMVAENRKNIELFQVPFLEAAKNNKFDYDLETGLYKLNSQITHRMQVMGETLDIEFANASIKVSESGMITEVNLDCKMIFPDNPGENSSLNLVVKFSDYGNTVVDKNLIQTPIVPVG